jgi:RNA polymerase II subunit A-like phosphatase
MERLLEERKLSLVVDLDQTVLHATVDPSVHEWLHDLNHPLHEYTEVKKKVCFYFNFNFIFIKKKGYFQGCPS